jgi:LPS sulfotransferase NodH
MYPIVRLVRGRRRRSADLSRLEPLPEARAAGIPDADFVSAAFDVEASTPPRRMVVVLSTPRSGSTYLCELLHRAGLCTAHEYFQPYQYLPLLAHRWGCVERGHVSWPSYARALERHRTSPQGVLGVNIHGSHVRHFLQALPWLTAPDAAYLWLRRRDKLRQAVSYGIARQTRQWSTHFARGAEPRYDYAAFARLLGAIHEQEDLIRAFLHERAPVHRTLDYEDLVDDPAGSLKSALGVESAATPTASEPGLRRQGDATNEGFLSRFVQDVLAGPDSSAP